MRNIILSLVFAITAIVVQAQEPVITMTTTKSINSQFSFGISAIANSTPIQVDWGNGVKENFTIGEETEFFGFPLKGSSVKVWGEGIASLNVAPMELTALDVTRATSLTYLYIKANQLATLDLSNCTALTYVNCSENLLTSLYLPSTSTLDAVNCDNNLLTSLDVSGATGITELICTNNKLTFASLPVKQPTWTTYTYSPQQSITLPKQIYSPNEEIDLSSQLTVGSNTTTYTWKTASGTVLVNGTDYNATEGKFTFPKTYTESFFCEMTNATFPDLTLKTWNISVLPIPSVVMTTTTAVGNTFSFDIRAIDYETPIQVDWGNGSLVNYTIGFSPTTVSGTLTGNTIKIYGVGIFYLNLSNNQLTALDVTNNTALTNLECYNNQLTALDVSNNTALIRLNCSSNQLTALDVSNNTALIRLNCSSNQLTTLDVSNNIALTNLSCSSNQLTALDVSNNIALVDLYCYSNQLTALDVSNSAQLEWLDCSSNQLTTVDVTNNTALTHLDCSYNQLTTVDVTNNTALTYLNCRQNQLTALDVTKNTALTYLNCRQNQLTALDVTNNTALTNLECYFNQLTALDVTKNTALTNLVCHGNQLTALDVTKNTALTNLECYFNQLTALDLSNNTALTSLDCRFNKLTALDVSKNIELTNLSCSFNQLTIVGVTNNPALIYLNCSQNQLTALDVTNNPALEKLECHYNQLTFSTLPIQHPSWTDYTYSPQGKLPISKKEFALNEEIDLSSQLTAGGNTTTYLWKTKGGVMLIKDVDYTESNGKFTFLKQPGDYFYCEMSNATFPELTLATENIFITTGTDEPSITMTTTTAVGSTFSFDISATTYNTPIKVDWGNGSLVSYTIGWHSTVSGKLAGNTIKIYGVGISYLRISGRELTALDVTNNIALKELNCYNNQLTALDVTNNTALYNLDCSSNQIIALDVTNNVALTKLACNKNQLTAVDVTNNPALEYFICHSNQLTTLNVSKNTSLTGLHCANNRLTTLNVSKNASLTSLYCANNQLTALDVSNNTALIYLGCESNQLSFSNLPVKQTAWTTYTYSPQRAVKLPKKQYALTEAVDLSSELDVNGNTTNYTWKTKGGATLVAGTDYNVVGGVTTFLRVQTDSVYCQMTNATFPELTLNTINIKVSAYPLSVEDNEVAISVYPNPATENFTIKMTEEIVRVEVYSITGVRVFENGQYSSPTVTVPLTNMPKGALLIKAYTRNGVYSSKVVKI